MKENHICDAELLKGSRIIKNEPIIELKTNERFNRKLLFAIYH
jgi:hypothetical protein